ncbi:HPP family protein [Oceanicoccus sagamiensis]|uniref:CBS domain-containing protein n=1 Tax=Oceanicoccus sagamiensis TaxID=716816 RepID=A0A1X9NGV3_9GAMM|nr:CBS domain-containing protein [Oceanicoccus sagamiensis]ARN74739.1 hypothetical protein BST96_11785 [Oceanicoccus sagamiensis]
MFYIIEQGARIKTPTAQLLKARGVPQVSAGAGTSAISEDNRDPLKAPVSKISQDNPYQQQNLKPERELAPVIYGHQIMTSPVVTASINETIETVWSLFAKHHFHHLPLVDDKQQLLGIVSDRDLLRFAANQQKNVGSHRIEQVMTRKVISAAATAEVRLIAEVMCRHAIGAVPITGEADSDDSRVLGIVSRSDILRTLVNRAPLELWA